MSKFRLGDAIAIDFQKTKIEPIEIEDLKIKLSFNLPYELRNETILLRFTYNK